jgi:dienelactone hydrolase
VGEPVVVPAGGVDLQADLAVPDDAFGVVVFAHGSGSGRSSPRNRQVAEALQRAGLATLLLDLLTLDEEQVDRSSGALRFDIGLLAGRLAAAVRWAADRPDLARLGVGLFGASTGAGAALVTAALEPALVAAVVSRGGRPDLAGDALDAVRAPTLLIVGGRDPQVLELNEVARQRLRAPSALEVVPGATHLFEEPGALERVASLAADWFGRHLRRREPRPG